ncbi:MAG: hypothetical protein ACPKPY_06355 [Nitrososphaeraceae archaeon]
MKFGLYDDTRNIPFDIHLENLNKPSQLQLLELRKFVKSLGDDVVEDIRPHRIVYAKKIVFRSFLDIKPDKNNEIILSLRSDRKNPSKIYKVNNNSNINEIKNEISNAYKKIN